MSKIITGTNAADTITVKESDVTVNAGLGNDSININSGSRNKVRGQQDNDTLTVNGGSNSFIWGGSGSDTIAVNSGIGTRNKIYGEADADTITVNGGSGNYINGGGGVDIITFNGGSKNEFYAEREDDIIHVYGGSENKICGGSGYDVIDIGKSVGLNNKIHGDGGKDRITLFGGKGNEIHGGSGSDVIKVTGGSNNVVRGEQDHDTITVTGGDKNKIYGGSGMDTLIIETTIGTGNYLYGEAGEDKITVKGGSGNYINGGGDIDTVIFAGGSDNKFYGERGNDTITVKGGENNLICGGSENDEITIENGVGTGNKIYGDAGQDTIVVNGGSKNEIHGGSGDDAIYVKGGSNNTVYGDKGNDTIEIHAGNQVADGGSGNDSITVRGGNNHTVKGGTGSDLYTIVPVLTSDTSLKINQKDLDSGDADVLHFQSVQRKEVRFTLENGILKIVHTSGGIVSVLDWQENPIETIIFADGKILTGAEVTRLAEAYEIDWDLGNNVSVTLPELKKGIRVNGYKENDFVITLNEAGELTLTDAMHGTITVSNWKGSSVQFIEFSSDDYVKAFTAEEINEQLFNVTVLDNNSSYTDGKDKRQEFSINLTADTNITIDSASDTPDRIKFADNHSLDNASWRISGNDLYINDYVEGSGETGGQVVIKNVKQSSVKDIELAEAVVHLVPDGNREYVGSDTFRDRYLFLDNVWSGTDTNTADWSVTIDAINSQDVLDFRFLPNNDRYYSVSGTTEGQDLVLKYSYSITPDSSATLGTVRLKNFFDADGTVNAEQGFPRIRMNRSVYAGYTSSEAWDSWVWERDQNHRWYLLNSGTDNNDTVDLRELVKPANRSWLYYAGKGDDDITAQEGDIVYGGAGSDTLKLTGSYAEVHGGGDDDTITIQGADGENLDHVVARSGDGNDVIRAYGSNHYINGGYGDDEIHIYDDGTGVSSSQNSVLSGSRGKDTIYIHGGNNHIASGASDDDTIYAYSGNGHKLNGGNGNDEIHIVDDGTKQSDNNRGDGGIGDDRLYIENGGQNHILLGGDGEDYLSVEGDNNTLDGGNDNDTLVVVNGTNNILSGGAGNDTLQILAGDNNELHGNEGDDILTGGSGADKLYGNEGNDELHGGAGNDRLYGSAGDDTLYGDGGDDYLSGGSGTDILTGGTGNDLFVHYGNYGDDTVTDYTMGEDTVIIGDSAIYGHGSIDRTELINNGKDVKFTIGDGSVTVQNGAGKTISLQDSRGRYTASDTGIVLGGDFVGSMNADAYLNTVITIDGRNAENGVSIIGNEQDNIIYAGNFGGTYQGGAGNDTLYGGDGNDEFLYQAGNDTIFNFKSGADVIRLGSDELDKSEIYGNDIVLSLTNGKTIILKDVAGQTIDYVDAFGNSNSITPVVTQQSIIKSFMKYLDNYPKVAETRDSVVEALGMAANYASNGIFPTWDALIERFISDVQTYGGSLEDITEDNKNVIPNSGLDNFLKNYCAIDLNNEDTGAIIGADAGGPLVKTAISIVPESGVIADLVSPLSGGKTVINGLTFCWPEAVEDDKQQFILDGLNTWWAEEGLNLIEESYGLSFMEEGVTGNEISVSFVNESDEDFLARVNWGYEYRYNLNDPTIISLENTHDMGLEINMKYFNSIDTTDVNGSAGTTVGNLDRVIAHELTHATLAATMGRVYNLFTPIYFKEGIAELTHGIDDFRTYNIMKLATIEKIDRLSFTLKPNADAGDDSYAGGYMLLRYFAKQAADHYASTLGNSSSGMLAGSFADSISTAASSFRSDGTAAVADAGSELASSMDAISSAMLTPLDSAGANWLGTDSLTSGLFSEKRPVL